jgi:putative PEP-CTERM system histidine kinase
MPLTSSALSHAAAFFGYAVFAILLAFRGARTWLTAYLVLAAVMTAAWAAIAVFVEWSLLPQWTVNSAEPLRDGAWFALILAVLYAAGYDTAVWRSLVVGTVCVVLLDALLSAFGTNGGSILGLPLDARVSGIATAVIGLVLVENIMRNLSRDQIWGIKLLAIGLFAVLVYELFVQLPEFLTNIPVAGLAAAMPLVFLVVLPLFVVTAVRNPVSALRMHSSRKIVFHTTVLIGVGVVLQGAAAAAYYVRTYGGDNATVLSIILGFSSIVVVAVSVASGSIRSRLKSFINENFFSYKFDYRLEWDKFIRALSAWDDGDMPLRVLRTLAELLDSPGGALWVFRERWHQYMPVAHWSMRSPELAPIVPDDPCLAAFKDEKCVYLQLTGPNANPSAKPWRDLFPTAWMVVPLRYRDSLIAVSLIHKPRVDRKLDWEDEKLVSLVALQLAAYLVQEETVQALADARQLEEFNKRFAFILHDTKNAVGQLSLLVRNVEQFGHDEEFRKDMVVTLRHSVEKLQGLLSQLRGDARDKDAEIPSTQYVNISAVVDGFVREKRKLGLDLVTGDGAMPMFARLPDEKAFLGVLDHVVTNAIEAAPKGCPVTVRIGATNGSVGVAIADKGPGMTQRFIADQLFRPLQTTKGKGFGIGAYQAREVMRDIGGNIDVRSKLGEGTTVTLLLPAVSEKEAV